jgi:hypothetical protein
MKSVLCVSLLLLLMPSAYAAELPGDSADGSFLHDANCLGCHDTGIYTRKDRRIRSLDALKGQLANCSHMANQQFSASGWPGGSRGIVPSKGPSGVQIPGRVIEVKPVVRPGGCQAERRRVFLAQARLHGQAD